MKRLKGAEPRRGECESMSQSRPSDRLENSFFLRKGVRLMQSINDEVTERSGTPKGRMRKHESMAEGLDSFLRKGVRVAEGARLESVYTLTGIKGSNPFPSVFSKKAWDENQRVRLMLSINDERRKERSPGGVITKWSSIPFLPYFLKKPGMRTRGFD